MQVRMMLIQHEGEWVGVPASQRYWSDNIY